MKVIWQNLMFIFLAITIASIFVGAAVEVISFIQPRNATSTRFLIACQPYLQSSNFTAIGFLVVAGTIAAWVVRERQQKINFSNIWVVIFIVIAAVLALNFLTALRAAEIRQIDEHWEIARRFQSYSIVDSETAVHVMWHNIRYTAATIIACSYLALLMGLYTLYALQQGEAGPLVGK